MNEVLEGSSVLSFMKMYSAEVNFFVYRMCSYSTDIQWFANQNY